MPSDRHGAARQFAIVAAVGACVALITPADAFACGVRMKLGRQNLQATPLCAIGLHAEAAEAGLERRALLRAFVGTGLALAESWPTEVFAERTFESMKKSKASYLPRLKTGVTFYEGVPSSSLLLLWSRKLRLRPVTFLQPSLICDRPRLVSDVKATFPQAPSARQLTKTIGRLFLKR